jgi:hypothetical protein
LYRMSDRLLRWERETKWQILDKRTY